MRKFLMIAALTAIGITTASAEPTAYQPAQRSTPYGYAETQLDATHVRISFSGNPETPREAVEAYTMYRAAEITLLRGYDHFVVTSRDVETISDFAASGPPLPPMAPRHYRQVTRYRATSDIVMRHGPAPHSATDAFDAREIEASLSWRLTRRF